MKAKFYLYICILTSASYLSSIQAAFSQCNCSPGVPATAVEYTTSFPTSTSFPAIEFPKFDPSIGTLNCITFSATMDGTTFSTATPTAGANRYSFLLALTPRLQAPGFNLSNTVVRTYGPDSLGSQNWIDSVNLIWPSPTTVISSKTYGPEAIMVGATFNSSLISPPVYYTTNLSTPVSFTFSISGGLTTTEGGSNYTASIATEASGEFKLTYYWCPNSVLASTIKNFVATLNNKNVKLEWTSNMNTSGSLVELQVSNDGESFKTVYVQPTPAGAGGTVSYQYLYGIGQANTDKLYFRIKQTDASGKESFTAIKNIALTGARSDFMSVFPNPATDKISLQFEKELDGDFTVDIVNLTGQRVYNRNIRLTRTRFASLDLNHPPSRGMYYIRATDQRTGAIYVNKLFMK